MSPKIINRENKKREILISAMGVFARQGVAKTKMIDIANEAGIGKGTIYEYFKNKDDIFFESFRYFMQQTDSIVTQRLQNIQDPVAKLEGYIDGWLESLADSIDLVAIMMDYWAEGIRAKNEDSVFNLKKIYAEYREAIQALLDEGVTAKKFKPVDTQITASILIGMLDGIALQWIMDRELFQFTEVADAIKKSFINGLIHNDQN
jgi:AcrR family transcriptional regulator